jgi:hypothetical protein
MHARPVVVLALSAATGAGLMLARSHQRRARNGSAAETMFVPPPFATAAVAESARPPVVGDSQPEPFRIEARTVSLPRPDGRRNGSSPARVSAASALPPVVLPPERISSATLIAIAVALAVCAVGLAAWAYIVHDHQHTSAAIGAVAARTVFLVPAPSRARTIVVPIAARRAQPGQLPAMSARSLPRSFAR